MDSAEYLDRFKSAKDFGSKSALLEEAKALENVDRGLFARQRESWEVPELENPYKSLVQVFGKDGRARFEWAKTFAEEDAIPRLFKDEGKEKRRKLPVTVDSMEKFEEQFLQIFCCNLLQYVDFSNMVVAGGSIAGTLAPLDERKFKTGIEKRKYYHDEAFAGSDIDIFLWGLSEEDANAKLVELYEQICRACPFEVICFRSSHAVTMVSQYPYRHVQVVLRIYSSPYEVLAGFDVDSCTYLYDGKNVFTTPRGHNALVSGYNTIDLSRRSLSYEMRLAKYGERGFEVLVPSFEQELVDPNIFDKPWNQLQGLARLIVMEKLRTPTERLVYHERQRAKKSRPRLDTSRRTMERMEKLGSAEVSDYSTVFLPWGPEFSAQKTLKLMKKKDAVLNGRWFGRDRNYNLHPCFFGTALEILEDCSPEDPPIPEDVSEDELKGYVRGPLTWMQDDPGRQQIGSFNPITDGDWEEGAYFMPLHGEICIATNKNDLQGLKKILEKKNGYPSLEFMRDFLGRSPVHVGIMAGAIDCVHHLLFNDKQTVDPTLRLPDRRSCLHLCSEYNQPTLLRHVIEAIEVMEKKYKDYADLPETEKKKIEKPPRNVSLADMLAATDAETKMTPLAHAIRLGQNPEIVKILLEAGANVEPCEAEQARGGAISVNQFPQSLQGGYMQPIAISPLLLLTNSNVDDDNLTKFVHYIITLAQDDDHLTMKGFNTVFHVVAFLGDARLLKVLIKEMKENKPGSFDRLISLVNGDMNLAIGCALEQQYLECADILYKELPHAMPTKEICAKTRMLASKIDTSNADWQFSRTVNTLASLDVNSFKQRHVGSACLENLLHAINNRYSKDRGTYYYPSNSPFQNDFDICNGIKTKTKGQNGNDPEGEGDTLDGDDDDDEQLKILDKTIELHVDVLTWLVEHEPEVFQWGIEPPYRFGNHQVNMRNYALGDGETTVKLDKVLTLCVTQFKNVLETSMDGSDYKVHALLSSLTYEKGSYREFVSNEAKRFMGEQQQNKKKKERKDEDGDLIALQILTNLQDELANNPESPNFKKAVDVTKGSPLPSSKTELKQTKEQAQEKLEDAIFRTYELSRSSSPQLYYYHRNQNKVSLPEEAGDVLLGLFQSVWDGDVDAVEALFAKGKMFDFPLVGTINYSGHNVLMINALSSRSSSKTKLEMLKVLLKRAVTEYQPISKKDPANSNKNPGKIDNLKLLARVENMNDNDSEEYSDEDDDEDGDGDDLEYGVDGGSDDERRRNVKQFNAALNSDLHASSVSPEMLLNGMGYFHIDAVRNMLPPHFAKEVDLVLAWFEESDGYGTSNGFRGICQLSTLQVALISGDVEYVKELCKFAATLKDKDSTIGAPFSHKFVETKGTLQLAIALDNVEMTKTLIEYGAGGINFTEVANGQNLVGAFKATQGEGKRYKPLSSTLEARNKNDQQDEDDEDDTQKPIDPFASKRKESKGDGIEPHIFEMALYFDAINVCKWIMDDFHDVCSTWEKTLTNIPSLDTFVTKLKKREKCPMQMFYPNLKKESNVMWIVTLTTIANRNPEEFNCMGRSSLFYSLVGGAMKTTQYLLKRYPELYSAPVEWPVPTPRDQAKPNVGLHPLLVVATKGPLELVESFLKNCKEPIPSIVTDTSQENLLHVILGSVPNLEWMYDICQLIASVNGKKVLEELLKSQNKDGVSPFMKIMSKAHNVDWIEKITSILDIPAEIAQVVDKKGSSLLHKEGDRLWSRKYNVDFLCKFYADDTIFFTENKQGTTPLDFYIFKHSKMDGVVSQDRVEKMTRKVPPSEKFVNLLSKEDVAKPRILASFMPVREYVFDNFADVIEKEVEEFFASRWYYYYRRNFEQLISYNVANLSRLKINLLGPHNTRDLKQALVKAVSKPE